MTATKTGVRHPDLDYVLLCLIRMHAGVSGYQLHTVIDNLAGYFFRAHLSQIYPALRRLHEEGLVNCSEVERMGKPDLKLYEVTEEGSAAADAWLEEPHKFEPTRSNADHYFLKLILMGHVDPEILKRYIDSGIAEYTRMCNVVSDDSARTELSFLSVPDDETYARYQVLWEGELSLIRDDFERRIELLERMRTVL